MKKNIYIIILSILLVGCSLETINTNIETTNDEIYNGYLKIAIIGDTPEIREENINFESVSLEEIQDIERISNDFDALFIMPEFFSLADDDKYIKMYKSLTIPTFFIESKKGHQPFTIENTKYESARIINEKLYAVGYLYHHLDSQPKEEEWQFYLNDEAKTSKEVFTNIFKTIDKIN